MITQPIIRIMLKVRTLILPLLLVGAVLFTANLVSKVKYWRQTAQRWEQNYSVVMTQREVTQATYTARVQQMEMTVNELERQKNAEIQELRRQIRLSGIRTRELEHALMFAQTIQDTLYIHWVDTVLHNCLTAPVHLAFRDTLATIDVTLMPDFSAQASYEVQADVYGFIFKQKVPVRERETRVGELVMKAALSNPLTRWTVKRKVIYMTEVKSNNPNLKLRNTQSLRVIDK